MWRCRMVVKEKCNIIDVCENCIGDACSMYNTVVKICDECDDDVRDLYEYEDVQLCEYCLLKHFEKI